MGHAGIRVRFPLLSSVLRPAAWSAALLLATTLSARPGAAADLRTERMIGPGVKWITLLRDTGPWVIRVIEADGESGYVRPGATFASERGLRAAPVSAQAQQATTDRRYPIAGVNGDFFLESKGPFEADPVGALVIGGEVIHTPYPRSALLIGADGHYAIRRLRLAAWAERPDGVRLNLRGVNQPRGADDLILYTPRFGLSTATNSQGTEVTLTGMALPLRLGQTYRARVAAIGERGDSAIPAEGVVLSGHGSARDFLQGLKVDDEVQLRLEFDPPVTPETEVVGGGPTLVRDGQVVVTADTEGFKGDVVAGRAPRTALGYNGRRLLLVTVDGRQPGASVGMSLLELAALMRELGCTDAMNLDGGGSTTAWVRGAVVNRPSDGRERRVAEGLFLFSTAPKGPPVRLIVTPEEMAILAGASCPVAVTAEDEFYNPVPMPGEPVRWQVDPALGSAQSDSPAIANCQLSIDNLQLPAPEAKSLVRVGMVQVQAGRLSGSARLRVYACPPRLEVTPRETALAPGATQRFTARPLDERGRPLIADGVPVRWSCPPELGQVDGTGLFRASAIPVHGELVAELAGQRVAVPVVVGTETRPLDGFETAGRWTAAVIPAGVKGSIAASPAAPHEGRSCLRLEYDFSGSTATRAVYAVGNLPVGRPLALRVWVRGDGGGAWLRARLRDDRGRAQLVDFTRSLGRLDDWRELTASIPAALPGPWTLEALYLVVPDQGSAPRVIAGPKGAIELDALAGDYVPAETAALPASDGGRAAAVSSSSVVGRPSSAKPPATSSSRVTRGADARH